MQQRCMTKVRPTRHFDLELSGRSVAETNNSVHRFFEWGVSNS